MDTSDTVNPKDLLLDPLSWMFCLALWVTLCLKTSNSDEASSARSSSESWGLLLTSLKNSLLKVFGILFLLPREGLYSCSRCLETLLRDSVDILMSSLKRSRLVSVNTTNVGVVDLYLALKMALKMWEQEMYSCFSNLKSTFLELEVVVFFFFFWVFQEWLKTPKTSTGWVEKLLNASTVTYTVWPVVVILSSDRKWPLLLSCGRIPQCTCLQSSASWILNNNELPQLVQ